VEREREREAWKRNTNLRPENEIIEDFDLWVVKKKVVDFDAEKKTFNFSIIASSKKRRNDFLWESHKKTAQKLG